MSARSVQHSIEEMPENVSSQLTAGFQDKSMDMNDKHQTLLDMFDTWSAFVSQLAIF